MPRSSWSDFWFEHYRTAFLSYAVARGLPLDEAAAWVDVSRENILMEHCTRIGCDSPDSAAYADVRAVETEFVSA